MTNEFNIVTRMASLDAIDTNGISVCRVASSTPKERKGKGCNYDQYLLLEKNKKLLPIEIMHWKACIT